MSDNAELIKNMRHALKHGMFSQKLRNQMRRRLAVLDPDGAPIITVAKPKPMRRYK